MKYVIVDIDGTLANVEHRLHLIKKNPPDWDEFHAQVNNDTPIEPVIAVVEALKETGHHIVFVTGRMSHARDDTEMWLELNVGSWTVYYPLFMRTEGDYRPDFEIKKEILFRYLGGPENVLLAIDDRKQVVDMWRRHGIRTLQVAEGDY